MKHLQAKFWPDAADEVEGSHYQVRPQLYFVRMSFVFGTSGICDKYKTRLQVPFSRVLYIESSDFRLKDSKDYYGLAPGKTVLLRCSLYVVIDRLRLLHDSCILLILYISQVCISHQMC